VSSNGRKGRKRKKGRGGLLGIRELKLHPARLQIPMRVYIFYQIHTTRAMQIPKEGKGKRRKKRKKEKKTERRKGCCGIYHSNTIALRGLDYPEIPPPSFSWIACLGGGGEKKKGERERNFPNRRIPVRNKKGTV